MVNLFRTKSLKVNAIFNALYQVLSMIVPLITAPYISRVLGPKNNGIYSYYYSIVTFFVFVSYGFADYGTKAIAEVREDKVERSKRFFSLMANKLIVGFLTILAYVIFILFVSNNDTSLALLIILSSFILASILDPTFYFQGDERFVSISIRNTAVRVLTTIFIFILVRNENDLLTYSLILGLGQLLSTLFMFLCFKKGDIKFAKINKKDLLPSLKGFLAFSVPALAVNINYSFNQTLLGLFGYSGAESGYFGQAIKVIQVLQTLASSLGIISLSRISYLLSTGNYEEIDRKVEKIFSVFWFVSLPMTFGIAAISEVFVPAFLGAEYQKSILCVIIMSPVILLASLNSLYINIYFRPLNKIKKQTIIIFIACLANVAVSCALIPAIKSYGTSIGRLVAEIVQVPFFIYMGKEIIKPEKAFRSLIKPLISSAMMFVSVFLFCEFSDINEWVIIILGILIGGSVYLFFELILKDKFFIDIISSIMIKIKQIVNVKRIKNKGEFMLNKKILVTGVNGQLGYDVCKELKNRGYTNVLGIDVNELDITDEKAVHAFVNIYKPDIIMHNAAWTAVDKAEENEDKVFTVNSLGTKYLAEAAKEVGAKMMYISTDYVFDGKGENFFEVDSPKNGLSVYGKTKSKGEDFVTSALKEYWIIRISWVFGINGNNFIRTMLKLAKAGKIELNVVDDQIGSPTYTYDLAILMCDMIETDKYGIYHVTNEGICSWYEFAKYIFEKAGYTDIKVNPVSTSEYKKLVPNQADRPLNSRLSKKSLDEAGFKHLPDRHDAVDRYIEELKEKGEF